MSHSRLFTLLSPAPELRHMRRPARPAACSLADIGCASVLPTLWINDAVELAASHLHRRAGATGAAGGCDGQSKLWISVTMGAGQLHIFLVSMTLTLAAICCHIRGARASGPDQDPMACAPCS